MSGEAWLYLLGVLINAVNLFLQVFFTIMYSDLEWYVVTVRNTHPVLVSIGPSMDMRTMANSYATLWLKTTDSSSQRLYQSYRPLQSPQHIYRSRSRRSRFLDCLVSYQRILDRFPAQHTSVGLQRKEVSWSDMLEETSMRLTICRILDNQHLLDATEIFRKLNVHKKVGLFRECECNAMADSKIGIIHQTRIPSFDVLLLSLQV
jgi:hypothetical protein